MAVGGIKDTDFTGFPLSDFGVNVNVTSINKTVLSDGNEDLETEATNVVFAFLNPKINKYTVEKYGFTKRTDGYMMTSVSEDIIKDDLVEYNGTTWRVINVKSRDIPAGGVSVYKFYELELYNG